MACCAAAWVLPGRAHAERLLLARVNDDVWRVPCAEEGDAGPANGGRVAQLVLARGAGGAWWAIGAGPTPASGGELRRAVRDRLGGDVADIVVTRAAAELALGSRAFDGARVWALRAVAERMAGQCARCVARMRSALGDATSLDDSAIRLPDRIVDRAPHRDMPAPRAGRLGPWHWRALERAAGQPVLVLRHVRHPVVVAQGLVWADALPDLRDTELARMLAAWTELRAWARGCVVLGEQGAPCGVDAIEAHLRYGETLQRDVAARLRAGEPEAAALERIEPPKGTARPLDIVRHTLNRQRAWREAEERWFAERSTS
jgi:hypothetical protein